ncbi:E7 protein [Ovis aries papillomavirus type 4]|nr:E7 protein [Ovis aries papillomavirus type 4]
MVHGPNTHKDLPQDESPETVTLHLRPLRIQPTEHGSLPSLKPLKIQKKSRPLLRTYYVTVACTCSTRLNFAVSTSSKSIVIFEELLTSDFQILCPTCANRP